MLRSRRLSITATWVALVAAVLPARAQDVTRSSIRTSEVHSVTSTVGGEEVDYQIVVSVPLDYEASSDAYSVVYYMDAWYAAGGIEETYHWLRAFNDIPPLILVGVSWNTDAAGALYNRSRDLTPTAVPSSHSAMLPVSGGGQDFFRFLSEELIPFVDREYRTLDTNRGLMGYSLGGLFASWVLVNHPGTFQRYLLGSPMVSWDDALVLRQEAEYAANHAELSARAYSCSGSEDFLLPDYHALRERLENRDYDGFEFIAELFPNETHTSLIPACYSRAFRVLYGGE